MQNERDTALLQARPKLNLPENLSEASEMQSFQDQTLRPILKLQNAFLLQLVGNTLLPKYPDWDTFSEDKKVNLLSAWSSKDLEVKKQIEGAILGLMTTSELDFYFKNDREIQRRIRAFVLERLRGGLRSGS